VPEDTLVPLAEFVEMEEDDCEGLTPFIYIVDKKQHLVQVIPSAEIVTSTKERRDFWRLLKGIVGLDKTVDPEAIAESVRMEMAQKLSSSLLSLMGGSGDLASALTATPTTGGNGGAMALAAPSAAGFEPAWIDTSECTACDECIKINGKIFVYNDSKKAIVKDPKGGPFKDIVKAAEKCPVKIIHPGTPANPNEKGLDKLVKRAEKFQ
jgi:pyruvate-ferredoxin/flavodoxin oxidoreductase